MFVILEVLCSVSFTHFMFQFESCIGYMAVLMGYVYGCTDGLRIWLY